MNTERTLVIGTRGSALALAQTDIVTRLLLEQHPALDVQRRVISTRGDRILDTALSKIGDKGLFVKEIETALQEGTIDVAVHSMKDLPTEGPADLEIGAIPAREDARDVFVGNEVATIGELAPGAMVATSSLRRSTQLLALRPDLQITDIRGNVETRLKKLRAGTNDGLVVALAGLKRLGLFQPGMQVLSPADMLPAPAQGALAIQVRKNDPHTGALVAALNDPEAAITVRAERALLQALDGGCQAPVAAHCRIRGSKLFLTGRVLSPDGATVLQERIAAPVTDATNAGHELARCLNARGANRLLEAMREH